MKKELTYFLIALLVFLAASGGYAAWFLHLEGVRKDTVEAASQVAAIQAEDAAIARAEGALNALAADEAAVQGYVLAQEDIVVFLEELERVGESLGATLEVASVTPTAEGKRIELALHVEGTFESVMRILGVIEYGPRDMRLSSLTLDTIPTDEESVWVVAAIFSVATLP